MFQRTLYMLGMQNKSTQRAVGYTVKHKVLNVKKQQKQIVVIIVAINTLKITFKNKLYSQL